MTGPKITFNPGPKILALLDQHQWMDINNFSGLSQAVTGSGSTLRTFRRLQAATGATASSTALARTINNIALSRGKTNDVLNWSKKIVLHLIFNHIANTTNGTSRFTLGKFSGSGVGALADKGIGIQVDNLALKGLVHDGTSGASVDLSSTLVVNQVYTVTIVSDGAGNTEWFLDGDSKGTSAAGPTGDSVGGRQCLQLETGNGGDAAGQTAEINDLKVYVEQ